MLVIRNVFVTGTHRIAPSGLPLLLSLFPGLAPWAFLSRPCGASFAPETIYSYPASYSARRTRRWCTGRISWERPAQRDEALDTQGPALRDTRRDGASAASASLR